MRLSGGAVGVALAVEAGILQELVTAERAYVRAGELIRLISVFDGLPEGDTVSYQWQRSFESMSWFNVKMSGRIKNQSREVG